jgi:type VI secretion system protein ImpM
MNTGFYGKVASRGDFVSRGLPQSFIKPWDAWLAAGLLASQEQLGGQWLDGLAATSH